MGPDRLAAITSRKLGSERVESLALAEALGAERHGTGIAAREERRPGDGRQGPVFTDAVGQDVLAKKTVT